MSTWIIVAVISGLASSLHNICIRSALRNGEDSTPFAWFYHVIRLFIFGLLIILTHEIITSFYNFIFLLVIGFLEILSIYVYMKMHSYTELSLSSLLARIRMVWVALIAAVFLGETLMMSEYFGIALIFTGLILVIKPKTIFVDKGVKFSLFSSLLIAISLSFVKYISNDIPIA